MRNDFECNMKRRKVKFMFSETYYSKKGMYDTEKRLNKEKYRLMSN